MQIINRQEQGNNFSVHEQKGKNTGTYLAIAFLALLSGVGLQALNEGANNTTADNQRNLITLVTPEPVSSEMQFAIPQPVPEAPVAVFAKTSVTSNEQQIFPAPVEVPTPPQSE